jgi:hypothetical protein
MRKTISLLMFIGTLGFSSLSLCQESKCPLKTTLIKGVYQGKNLVLSDITPNSIQEITINGVLFSHELAATKIELDFSPLLLHKGYEVNIAYCAEVEIPYSILNETKEK